MPTLFDDFYQRGFVARDLDRAAYASGKSHGITRFRRKEASPTMESAHAWIGATMIELIAVTPDGPDINQSHLPQDPAAIRLHHHGFRLADARQDRYR